MELRQLRYFVAVAEEGSFGAAANRLSVSQPPITRQIHKLEDEIGVSLFRRTAKGAELTAAGHALLEDARSTLAGVSRAAERSRAAQRGELGTVELAYFGSPIYRVVPAILQAFRRTLPNVSVSLHRMSKDEQFDALRAGKIHIGFGRYYHPEPDIAVEEVLKEGVAVAVPESLTKDPPEKSRLSLFEKFPVILYPRAGRPNFADEVVGAVKRAGITPKVAAVTEDVRSALTLTAAGVGLAVVPGSVVGFNWYGVRFLPLDMLHTACSVDCAYRKSDTSPLLRAMLATVRAYRTSPLGNAR